MRHSKYDLPVPQLHNCLGSSTVFLLLCAVIPNRDIPAFSYLNFRYSDQQMIFKFYSSIHSWAVFNDVK